jgi:hypothetical protein
MGKSQVESGRMRSGRIGLKSDGEKEPPFTIHTGRNRAQARGRRAIVQCRPGLPRCNGEHWQQVHAALA